MTIKLVEGEQPLKETDKSCFQERNVQIFVHEKHAHINSMRPLTTTNFLIKEGSLDSRLVFPTLERAE